jgi:hypothetical protein
MIKKLKHHRVLFLLILISIGLFSLYLKIQPALTYSYSSLFDGNKYLDVYQFFQNQTDQYNIIFPINSRILVPFLAAQLPFSDPENNFILFNIIFFILSVLVIYFLWRQLGMPTGHIMTGFFWLFIHWVGIIRYNIFDPITVDVPLYLFQALLLFIIYKRKFIWLLLLGPVATIQKESFPALLIIIFLLSLYENIIRKSDYRNTIVIALSILVSYTGLAIVNFYFPPVDPGKNAILVILFHLKETMLNPFRIIRWMVAIFTSYGPLLMLAIWVGIKSRSILRGDKYILLLSLTYLFLSLLAGGDMTRIAFLGFPFIMTWILLELKETKGFLFKAAFIAGIPLLKLFGTIPDPAIMGWERFNNWFPEFANPVVVLLWLIYGIMCLAMFRIIDKKLSVLS